jgi:threonine dehydratase
LVDSVITVTTDEICAAIKDTFNETRAICEPSGAMGLAGLKKYVADTGIRGQSLLAVQCGANIDFDRLRYISERTQTGEKREAILAVVIDERPGSFKAFCTALEQRNISEFNYRYARCDAAQIFAGVQVSGDHDRHALVADLATKGYAVEDLTDNEMAKLHIRHMVGGRAPQVGEEQVYRFDFPERPGALLNFLNLLGDSWNISMFHYRNHGSAFGRVLVGLQATANEQGAIGQFLDTLKYRYVDETNNPACRLFLGDGG